MLSTTSQLYFVLLTIVHSSVFPQQIKDICLIPRDPNNCKACVHPNLDPGTGCTTCMEPGPIECTPGDQDCGVGNFTFSVLFHSYANPSHMCQDCGQNGPALCDNNLCKLRFLYCLQPHGSSILDPPLLVQKPINSDNYTFEEGFIVQNGTNNRNLWNRSNPFMREFQTWPRRVRFYIITFHRPPQLDVSQSKAVDRFEIDLELNISTKFTQRRTYFGIHNISQFDLSFRISGECGENFYGPLCSKFCLEERERFTCDSEGNMVCANPNLDVVSNCTKCVVMGREVANNCEIEATFEDPTTVVWGSGPSSSVVGGAVGGVLSSIIVLLLLFILCLCIQQQEQEKTASEQQTQNATHLTRSTRTAGSGTGMEPSNTGPELNDITLSPVYYADTCIARPERESPLPPYYTGSERDESTAMETTSNSVSLGLTITPSMYEEEPTRQDHNTTSPLPAYNTVSHSL